MNTLANLYNHALTVFTLDPNSQATEAALTNLVSAFAVDPYPVTVIGIIKKDRVKETDKNFWIVLESYGLCVRFLDRKRPGFAYAVLGAAPLLPDPNAGALVVEQPAQVLKAAA